MKRPRNAASASKRLSETNGLIDCDGAGHGDVTGGCLPFAPLLRYVAPAIKFRGRNKRAVGSGSGGDNRLPIIGGK